MASKALVPTETLDWREAFRASLKRALQMAGALILFGAMLFLALSLISYTQADPSPSTAAAASGPVANWMGNAGAWAAERALFSFGWVSVLALPSPAIFLTPHGLENVGPRAFGFDLEFRSVFEDGTP